MLREGINRIEVEHFWLCGACYISYDFSFGEDGRPGPIKKSSFQIATDLAVWLDRVSDGDIVPASHLAHEHLSTPPDEIGTVWRRHLRSL
jgi:hypothetical protein